MNLVKKKGAYYYMYLERMGIFGMQENEDIILAATLTGDPLLMIGTAGAAKTMIIDRLGEALKMKTQIYNCSAINFEDIIGYVLPADTPDSQGNKYMEIIRSPYAIHDVEILGLDELSRCRIDRQNDLLTVLRERRIQGVDLQKLQLIFAAMNPIQEVEGDTYDGAEPLDKAFAERFPWTIVVKVFSEMDKEDKKSIVRSRGKGDSPALKRWAGKVEEEVGANQSNENMESLHSELIELLASAAQYMEAIERDFGEGIEDYIITFSEVMAGQAKKAMSGRTAGMFFRNIVSLAAIQKAMQPEVPIEMTDVALKAVLHSFPDMSYSDAIDENKILVAHKLAEHHLKGSISELALAEIKKDPDPVNRVLRAMAISIDSVNFSTLINEALEHLRDTDPLKAVMFATAVFFEIKDKDYVTAHILNELAKEVKKIISSIPDHQTRSTAAEAAQKVLMKEMKPMFEKAKTEQERQLLQYSTLLYGKVYAETSPEESSMKSFNDVHGEFEGMLKRFKGASAKMKIK